MSRRIRLALLACPLLAACGGKSADPPLVAGLTCPIPSAIASPTFAVHILPALQLSCGSGSAAATCHGSATPAGHVSYETNSGRTVANVYADLVNADPPPGTAPVGMKYIKPNDIPNSWLYAKITQDAPGGNPSTYGNRMPYAAPNVCAATVQTIASWISSGAPP